MSSAVYERVRANPQFQQLVAKRSRFAWTLTLVSWFLFYGFVLVVAFNPTALGQPIAAGSMWTVGVVIEMFLFCLFWALIAWYVVRANGEFDTINQQVVKDAIKGGQ